MDLRCDALLIDSDGTLVNSEAAIRRSWRTWCGEYGLDVEWVHRVSQGRRSSDTIAELLPADQAPAGLARVDELERADLADVTAMPGAAALLDAVPADAWALVTSGDLPLVTARLRAAGLPRPTVLVTADDVSQGKPDPAGYRLAAASLGVPASRCVVFEDSAAGVEAGRAAGAFVVALTTTHPAAELAAADLVVPDLAAVSLLSAAGDGPAGSARLALRVG
jgi:sugar-phosphatase